MKNKITPLNRKHTISPASQQSLNTQNNFMSVNELSSVYEQHHPTTISGLRKKHLMQYLINKIKYLIAPYALPPNVRQNWSEEYKTDVNDDEKGTEREEIISEIKYKYGIWHFFMMIEVVCAVFLFWAASIQLVFLPRFSLENNGNLFQFSTKAVPCIIIIIKLILKQILILHQRALQRKNLQTPSQQGSQKQISESSESELKLKSSATNEEFYNNLKDIIRSLIYSCSCATYMLIHTLSLQELRYFILAIIVIVFFTKVWSPKQNIQKIYSYVEAKDYKNQFRILVLFFLVLGACHFIALVLYGLTYLYPQNNWINSVDKVAVKQSTWISHYTCCIYFTISTMATVGYGDFTAVQTGEMFLISFIQLFGTALFGYMINVVGLSVVQINKKNQEFDNNISTINKLQSHYQISRQLCQKFKNDIIKNESVKKQTPLSQNEETQFFKIIQNSLKEQFILETNIKVIKKSIFFLTHFTVNFQNQIALKLIRKIYKKHEKLPLVDFEGENGERCMLIINSGSVDIDIANQSSNIEMKKFIKNISPQEGKPTLNVFGYSALILNKDIDLEATTKDTSVIYLLKRKDVLECMDKNMLDFEGIGELRERILQYRNINHVQAPSMMDIERHFIPNIFFVNKRKKTICQHRSQYERSRRRCRIKVITLKNYQFRTMVCIDLEESSKQSNQQLYRVGGQEANRNNSQQQVNSMKIIDETEGTQAGYDVFMKLDQVKNYENFMKKSNISKIMVKYHQYLRKQRKQRYLLQEIQHMLINKNEIQENSDNSSNYAQSVRKYTYTEGMNRITERLDQ